MLLILALGKWRQRIPGVHWPANHCIGACGMGNSLFGELRASERLCQKGGGHLKNDTHAYKLLGKGECVCVYGVIHIPGIKYHWRILVMRCTWVSTEPLVQPVWHSWYLWDIWDAAVFTAISWDFEDSGGSPQLPLQDPHSLRLPLKMVSQVVDVSGSPTRGFLLLPLRACISEILAAAYPNVFCVPDQVTLRSTEIGFHVTWATGSWAWWHSFVILAMCVMEAEGPQQVHTCFGVNLVSLLPNKKQREGLGCSSVVEHLPTISQCESVAQWWSTIWYTGGPGALSPVLGKTKPNQTKSPTTKKQPNNNIWK